MREQLERQKVRMARRVCSKCGIKKDMGAFYFRKDTLNFRNQCKECWRYATASRRYGVTFEQAKLFYSKSNCMCCGELFTHKKQQHLHHVGHKVRGIVCTYCNLALRQETCKDHTRIKSCLQFMSEPRKNPFDRVNPQGSRQMETDPSTIKRRAHSRQCKMCNEVLSLSCFYRQKYVNGHHAFCKECHKIYVKTYKYGLTFDQVKLLRQTPTCDCCSKGLQTPYIHHIGDKILGVLCRECNILLEQESEVTRSKLEACSQWMMVI